MCLYQVIWERFDKYLASPLDITITRKMFYFVVLARFMYSVTNVSYGTIRRLFSFARLSEAFVLPGKRKSAFSAILTFLWILPILKLLLTLCQRLMSLIKGNLTVYTNKTISAPGTAGSHTGDRRSLTYVSIKVDFYRLPRSWWP